MHFCLINSHVFSYFISDESPPPQRVAPSWQVAPPWQVGTLDTHLSVQVWFIFCVYNWETGGDYVCRY